MSDVRINLDGKITNLEKRRDELEASDPPGPSLQEISNQKETINSWIAELNEKINTLYQIKANKAAASVIVTGVSDVEKRKFDNAMSNLNKQIQRDQTFANTSSISTDSLRFSGYSQWYGR